MKKIFALAIAAALLATTQVSASLGVGSLVTLDTTLPGGSGGQFGASDGGSPAGLTFDPFVTFCAELGETIGNNGTYAVTGISTSNSSGTATLTSQAAYLYTQFREGTLDSFNAASADDSNALQYGIWQGIGYTHEQIQNSIGNSTANSYQTLWNARSGSWLYGLGTEWANGDLGSVMIMQLGGNQDQLFLAVPEPGSIVIWSMIGVGVAGMRRRRK